MHGGGPTVSPGRPLPDLYVRENVELVERGAANLVRHVEIARKFGVPVVVAVNRFPTDTERELLGVRRAAESAGATCALADHWARGGQGALELADAVAAACQETAVPRFLYPLELPLRRKIEIIAREVYGAGGVSYTAEAEASIDRYEALGYGNLPVCMAKTHLSLSHDPARKGVPSGYTLPIREVRASVGAGFVYPLCGDMQTMPGLPARPAFMGIDIDEKGEVVGLS